MIRLRYRARFLVWERLLDGRFWVGPFATAEGAYRIRLGETYSDEQRRRWLGRP